MRDAPEHIGRWSIPVRYSWMPDRCTAICINPGQPTLMQLVIGAMGSGHEGQCEVARMVQSPDVYEPEPAESVSETVIRAVADVSGVDPLEMDERLFDTVDPCALDAFFASGQIDSERRVSFTFAGYRVVVDESRTVHLTEAAQRSRGEDPATPQEPASTVLRGAGTPWRLAFQE